MSEGAAFRATARFAGDQDAARAAEAVEAFLNAHEVSVRCRECAWRTHGRVPYISAEVAAHQVFHEHDVEVLIDEAWYRMDRPRRRETTC